ncbi:MAG: MGMT family protein [Deltaproteobacteria bacterium]|nr:MGMT family protein [Deltaproteobacteria bacterium]
MTNKENYRRKINSNLDLTAFQKKVLITIMDIPEGKTRSYAWVAKKAGSPLACRAVGQALAKNPYAPDVPCHRVIASDGSIGGYSGGLAEKRRLLMRETAVMHR